MTVNTAMLTESRHKVVGSHGGIRQMAQPSNADVTALSYKYTVVIGCILHG